MHGYEIVEVMERERMLKNVVFEKLNTRTSSSDRAALSKGAAIINRLSCMSSMRFVFKSNDIHFRLCLKMNYNFFT